MGSDRKSAKVEGSKRRRDAGPKTSATKRGSARRSRGGRFSLWFLLPVLLVIGLRFWTVSQLVESPLLIEPQLEDASYLTEARNLTRSPAEFTRSIPRGSPLYTRIVSATLDGGVPSTLPWVQVVVETLTTLLLVLWVGRRFGTLAGVAAGVLYALDPLGGFFAARLIPTTWATLLFLAALVALDGARKSRTWARSLGFGILIATGFAFSPLLFVVFLLVALVDRFRSASAGAGALETSPDRSVGPDSMVRALTWSALAVVPLLLVLSLTLSRHDAMRQGGPTLSWGSGISTYQASSLDFGGTPRSLTRPSWKNAGNWRSEAWESLEREGSLYELSRYYSSSGLRNWIEQPIETVGLLLVKTAGTLGSWPIPDALSAAFLFAENAPAFQYGMFTFALWLGLALAGWWCLRSRSPQVARLFALGGIAIGLTALLGTTSAAARQPVLPLLAALGGIFLAHLFGPRSETGKEATARPPALAFALLVLGVLVSIASGYLSPTRATEDRSEEFRLLSRALAIREDWTGATRAGETAVQIAPDNIDARVSLSRLYQRDGLAHASEEQLVAAYAADSTHTSTLLALANHRQQQDDLEGATALVTRLVLQRPNNPLYLNELGQLYLRGQRLGSARSLFLRALEIKPDYRVAQSNLETVVRYERSLTRQLYPDDMQLPADDPLNQQIQDVVQFMQEGSWSRADSVLQVAEAARPEHILPHFMRAGYHAQRGEDSEAVQKLEFCHQLAPCRIAVVQRLAVYYTSLGQKDRAVALVQGCIGELAEEDALRTQWDAVLTSLSAAP